MGNDRKRELAREYKERKQRRGVYTVRCAASGQVWASASSNLDAQQNSLWFQLKLGSHPNRILQDAWKQHSEDAFSFEVAAELSDEDRTPYALKADPGELETLWREKLGAARVTG
jgi:hypothetical protein